MDSDSELPTPESATVQRLAAALRAAAPSGSTHLVAEWSQAGSQHSGRAFAGDAQTLNHLPFPDDATTAFAALRAQMARPAIGTWLSARITLTKDGEPDFHANYSQRPKWNAPGLSMLEPTTGQPVPTQDRWLIDLQHYPRDRGHIPAWLAPTQIAGEEVAALRTALDGYGIPRASVVLPGEPPGPAFEGRLEIVRYSAAHYVLRVTDYGQHHLLGEFRTERDACMRLWQYLSAPMPPRMRASRADLAQRTATAVHSYQELGARLANVGVGGIITNLAAGVPYDRFGGLDGLYFFGWGTPWEQRSLPQTAIAPGASFVTVMALHPVEVQAEIVEPWFGQPGGGIRFHVEGGRTMRDLVREQYLAVVDIVG
ncbi:MAG: TNT domain-containing protein [Beutenbergiaceae bacterium]